MSQAIHPLGALGLAEWEEGAIQERRRGPMERSGSMERRGEERSGARVRENVARGEKAGCCDFKGFYVRRGTPD